MIKWRYYIGMWMAVALAWGMTACSDSNLVTMAEEDSVVEGTYYLNLNLRMADKTDSRAANPDTPSMPGAKSENQISSLHVFFKVNEGSWQVFPIDDVNLFDGEGTEAEVRIPLEEPLPEGITMCLGANLNEKQVEAFMNGDGVYSLSSGDDTSASVTLGLAPYSIGYKNFPETSQNIAMFCTKEAQPQKVQGKNAYTVSFSLKRLVAKVLLTCNQAEEAVPGGETGITYAQVKMKDGWVRQDSIWYLVNARNRSTYIMQKLTDSGDTDANVEDPNPDLTSYVNAAYSTSGEEYWPLVDENFIYLGRTNFYASGYFRPVLPYQADRMENNASNPYTEGIYCPENTFFYDSQTGLDEKLRDYDASWGMITHVAVMAKFTPYVLQVEYGLFDYVEGIDSAKYPQFTQSVKESIAHLRPSDASNPKDEDVFPIQCGSETVAYALLTASLMKANMLMTAVNQENKIPRETFFHHREQNGVISYYTYGAARIKYDKFDPAQPTVLGNYVSHIRGWGYYYTYIDNRAENKKTTESFVFYKHGQVERNRYYILRITSFSGPGASIENPNYIEVNTEVLGWISAGDGEITLD